MVDKMSSLEELENSIIEQCLDQEGILTLLHENNFDDEKCQNLIDTLMTYQHALGKQKFISRKMAGYIRTIEMIFDVAVAVYNSPSTFPQKDHRIVDAHPKILELMDNIFDVNLEN